MARSSSKGTTGSPFRTSLVGLALLALLVGILGINLSSKHAFLAFGTNDDDNERGRGGGAEVVVASLGSTDLGDAVQTEGDDEDEVEEEGEDEDDQVEVSTFFSRRRRRRSSLFNAQSDAGKPKSRTFGVRHGHRLAHVEARRRPRPPSSKPRRKLANPVVEDDEDELLPFNSNLVRERFRSTPRVEMEAEYFRFEDDFGLIDTGWSDDEVLFALQRLVDIYAQANIRIRLRRSEALARVRLSRERSLAYWFYVDYPKRHLTNSTQRQQRKALMNRIIGKELVSLFEALDTERQGLFDFIVGWPEERTPWENANVVGMYPTFYYFYMNGGGEEGCMRFRTGDCNTPKTIRGVENDALNVYCYRMDVRRGEDRGRTEEIPIVRSWEGYNFTADMAIRLVAHEMGHAMKLKHPNRGCVQVSNWEQGNLMTQVMMLAGARQVCRVTGWPHLAAKATFLTDDQIATARDNVKRDLRETRPVSGSSRVGKTTEVRPTPCKSPRGSPIIGFVASTLPVPESGTITRVRWKSGRTFDSKDRIKISVGRMDRGSTWRETRSEIVRPHSLGSHVHQEHDVTISVEKGDLVAILLMKTRDEEGLMPESHYYSDPDALAVDVVGEIPYSKRDHPTINHVISVIDKNALYPSVVPRAAAVEGSTIRTTEEGWTSSEGCAEWIFNYDLDVSPTTDPLIDW